MRPILPFTLLLRTLPDRLHADVIGRICNHLLKGQRIGQQLMELEGKRIALRITDTDNQLMFTIRGGRLEHLPAGGWDVRISGALEDFWRLATREEDPDTLFFNRRLAIEGDTQTGLYIKNMLDALDFDLDAHLEAVLGPRLAGRAGRLLRSTGLDRRVRDLLGQLQF